MDEKSLLRVALICTLTGIFILILISEKFELPDSNLNNITNKSIGSYIKTKARVSTISKINGGYILNIKDRIKEVPVIIFTDQNLTIDQNSLVEVSGVIADYKGKLEIEAKSIKIVK